MRKLYLTQTWRSSRRWARKEQREGKEISVLKNNRSLECYESGVVLTRSRRGGQGIRRNCVPVKEFRFYLKCIRKSPKGWNQGLTRRPILWWVTLAPWRRMDKKGVRVGSKEAYESPGIVGMMTVWWREVSEEKLLLLRSRSYRTGDGFG